jgi:hypothetical protein
VPLATIRPDLLCRKRVESDTGWRSDPIAPRFGPYPVTRPCPSGWEWRAFALAADNGRRYRLFFEVDPLRGKWKAALVLVPETGDPVAVLRFEDQPGGRGGGLHVHANCDANAGATGAESLDMAYVLPDHGRRRRRRFGWTKSAFCHAAGRFFRTDPIDPQGELAL